MCWKRHTKHVGTWVDGLISHPLRAVPNFTRYVLRATPSALRPVHWIVPRHHRPGRLWRREQIDILVRHNGRIIRARDPRRHRPIVAQYIWPSTTAYSRSKPDHVSPVPALLGATARTASDLGPGGVACGFISRVMSGCNLLVCGGRITGPGARSRDNLLYARFAVHAIAAIRHPGAEQASADRHAFR